MASRKMTGGSRWSRVGPLALAAVLVLSACGPDGGTGPGGGDEITSVVVTPSQATVGIDETTLFEATVRNGRGEIVQVTVDWSSSNTAIAFVDQNVGLVRGVAPGSVTISATAAGKVGNASVTVRLLPEGQGIP
ncbi:MAG: hypothetical protein HKO65_19690 [Gemmatimonadetes bacterium]|nr:Ig-like domain-containing protein [Gemmatimonadota bacterium]NNM07326.1 hypothetical protein [Gemmatimonadota bacterium]